MTLRTVGIIVALLLAVLVLVFLLGIVGLGSGGAAHPTVTSLPVS